MTTATWVAFWIILAFGVAMLGTAWFIAPPKRKPSLADFQRERCEHCDCLKRRHDRPSGGCNNCPCLAEHRDFFDRRSAAIQATLDGEPSRKSAVPKGDT